MKIIALDPGKTTGIAFYDTETKSFTASQMDFDQTTTYVWQEAASYGSDLHVVSESFIITMQTAKNTQATWSLELIGFFRAMSRAYCGRDLVLQAPSQAKRFSSDERLKIMDWYTPGKGHANDAARHLMLYCVSRGLIEARKLVIE